MQIATLDDAKSFAAALDGPPRGATGRNAIGSALLFGRDLIETNRIDGWRRVIDFSGDTTGNTYGPPIEVARDEVLASGIDIINALAIATARGFGDGGLPGNTRHASRRPRSSISSVSRDPPRRARFTVKKTQADPERKSPGSRRPASDDKSAY